MATNEVYKHRLLSPGQNIRVLILKPAQELDLPIECSLREISLSNPRWRKRRYEAVSYVWGSPTGDQEIRCEGKTLLVTPNCLSALRHFRHRFKTRVLWVDAVCIDQNSTTERNHQVQLMGNVYSSARRVLIWLREITPQVEQLFRDLHKYVAFSRAKRLVPFARGLFSCREIRARLPSELAALDSNDYFDRTWTLQELLLALKPVLCSGHRSLSLDVVRSVMRLGGDFATPKLSKMCKEYTLFRAVVFYRATPAGRSSVSSILPFCSARQCSDPKDKVYGLYSLLGKLGCILAPVDYNKAIEEIFEDFTFDVFRFLRSLDPYLWLSHGLCAPGLPSWVPDYRRENLRESLPPGEGLREFRDAFELIQCRGLLVVEGIIHGLLVEVEGPAILDGTEITLDGCISVAASIVAFASKAWSRGEYSPAQHAGTIFSNAVAKIMNGNNYGGETLVREIRKALELWQQSFPSSERRHLSIIGQLFIMGESSKSSLVTLKSVGMGFVGKSFVTTSNGSIGIVAGKPEAADLVALVRGCTLPMILRPTTSGNYRLMGVASLGGLSQRDWPNREDGSDAKRITLE